jgi:hypothetical protein
MKDMSDVALHVASFVPYVRPALQCQTCGYFQQWTDAELASFAIKGLPQHCDTSMIMVTPPAA